MQRISITNPQNIIDGTAKKYYFKLRNTGGPKGDKGDKGDTGATGPQGAKGDPCTVVVNSTATLEPGSNAYVTNTGSLSNAVLNFGIPKGDKGDTGPQGQKGERGQQGEQGPIGPQGTPGQNATVYVGTTITTNPGTQARVYNTGTENNAVLNFEIPRGAKGDTGSQGPQGPTGPAGQNFAATVVTELPETGDSSKLYLTPKAHTTSTATGNPITASVSEDAGAIESFQLDGDTYQQTYTGKNILNYITGLIASGGGLTNTINNDGTITTVGKPNSNYNKIIEYYDLTPYLEDGATYTLSSTLYDNKTAAQVRQTKISDSSNYSYDTLESAKTFTVDKSQYTYRMGILTNTMAAWGGESLAITKGYQLEKSATATTFEPYVGGTPSPNPDYPQLIQTVTGEQTVEIVGKNLFDKDNVTENSVLEADGSLSFNTTDYSTSTLIPVKPSTTYYKSRTDSARFKFYDAKQEPTSSVYTDIPTAGNAQSFATPSNCYYVRFTFKKTFANTVQLELGSTGSSYAPYSKQTLPLDLGSIELCKLGTYQDYIYKDGENWKVHKATAILTLTGNSSENWYIDQYAYMLNNVISAKSFSDIANMEAYCNSFSKSATGQVSSYVVSFWYNAPGTGVRFIKDQTPDLSSFRNWLASNNQTVYYPLATATDTPITDQTLIAQLEAIRTASLENGANTITNTATGSNLAGDMEIGYYGYNPRNRYDKWLWLDINNNYEQIGS